MKQTWGKKVCSRLWLKWISSIAQKNTTVVVPGIDGWNDQSKQWFFRNKPHALSEQHGCQLDTTFDTTFNTDHNRHKPLAHCTRTNSLYLSMLLYLCRRHCNLTNSAVLVDVTLYLWRKAEEKRNMMWKTSTTFLPVFGLERVVNIFFNFLTRVQIQYMFTSTCLYVYM